MDLNRLRSIIAPLDHYHSGLEFMFNFTRNLRPRNFLADNNINSILDINPNELVQEGFEGGVYDLDHTLSIMHEDHIAHDLKFHLKSLTSAMKGIIASNCNDERFHEIGQKVISNYDNIKAIKVYRKNIFNRLQTDNDKEYICGVYQKRELSYFQLLSSKGKDKLEPISNDFDLSKYKRVKKPNNHILKFAQHLMEISNAKNMFMVGDRNSTDISGGNQYRIKGENGVLQKPRTYRVTPYGKKDKLTSKLIARPFEWIFRNLYTNIFRFKQ
jgi:predicted HAD superfamily phosphohydrolase YqeG